MKVESNISSRAEYGRSRRRGTRGLGFLPPVLAGLGWFLAAIPAALAADEAGEIVAVASKASDDYLRAKLADGSFQPETYAFGPGGVWAGDASDFTIDKLKFIDVARAMVGPLASQKYLAAKDPDTAKLLIMVYWGTTWAPGPVSESLAYDGLAVAQQNLELAKRTGGDVKLAEDQLYTAIGGVEVENRRRDRRNAQNAAMLGYDSWWDATSHLQSTALRSRWQDMIDELEERRYFVVLMAYDFQLMWKQKKTKLLWETRFSIRERRNEFDKQVAAMAGEAAKYFGRDSHGLVHKAPAETRVDLGEMKVLGVVPEKPEGKQK